MTVIGDGIVLNCRECFARDGFGVRLSKRGELWECEHNPLHRYRLVSGFMQRA
ncbi:MAG: hypothetical protein AABW54_04225 [Candidatus Micrarchaeota archaeon]